MKDSVTPSNITGAAVIAQFAIIVIMFVGAFTLHKEEESATFYYGKPRFSKLAWIILTFTLLTIGCLLFSDEFSKLWHPLLGDISIPTVPWQVAVFVMFFLDIVLVTILVFYTGGSRRSAFGPLYFLLPTLAILLREPLGLLVLYVVLTIAFFLMMLHRDVTVREDSEQPNHVAYVIVSIACFILATFIGYVTRIK